MNKQTRRVRISGRLGFSLLGGASILLLLLFADSATAAVQSGLQLCCKTVIPALFPFMVASEILVECGGAAAIGRLLSKPMQVLLGVPGAAACPVVLGAICGFPTGARAMAGLYDKGALNARQCTRLLTFINLPSSAYLISAVGVTLLGSRRTGLLLWLVSLICAALTALVTRLLLPDDTKGEPLAQQPVRISAGVFTGAVTAAAQNMLFVCAYVLFFSAVLGALQSACARLSLSPTINALLYGLVEMSGGVALAARIPNAQIAVAACAALCCWSGISVMCRIITVCRGRGISFVPYVLAKLAQGALAAVLSVLAMRYLFPLLPPEDTHAWLFLPTATTQMLSHAINLAFLCSCAVMMATKPMHRKRTADIY